MMTTTLPETEYRRAIRERRLTCPDRDHSPWRARGYSVVTVSAVTEAGVVRCIGWGYGPHTLTKYAPYVDALLEVIGTPGIATTGQPVEWTGAVYGIPHYVMDCIDREAIPRGVYLFRRIEPGSDYYYDWSFCFERTGEYLAPLPKGW